MKLHIHDVAASEVTLVWESQQIAQAYEVQIQEEQGWRSMSKAIKGHLLRKKNLLPDTQYAFRGRALQGQEWSPFKDILEVKTLSQEQQDQRPSAPVRKAVTENSITLGWDKEDAEDVVYEAQWKEADGLFWNVASDKLKGNAMKKKHFAPETSYVFRVRASQGGEWGPFSPSSASIQTTKTWISSAFGTMLVDQGGKSVLSAEALREKVILVYFTASWCGPCQKFTPSLVTAYKALKAADRAVEVVVVSWDEKQSDFQGYFEKMGSWLAVPFDAMMPNGMKRSQMLTQYYKVQGIPRLVAFAPDGRVLCGNAAGMPLESAFEGWHKQIA